MELELAHNITSGGFELISTLLNKALVTQYHRHQIFLYSELMEYLNQYFRCLVITKLLL